MTTIIARATGPGELRPVVDAIHDCWFDVEAVRFNEPEHTVEVPVRRETPLSTPLLRRFVNWLQGRHRKELVGLLRLRKVNSCLVTDDQGVGSYDINTIAFDEKKKVIIWTGIPTKFELDADGLDVTVEK